MEEWPDLLLKGLHERFDELSHTVELQKNITPLIDRTSKLLSELKNQLDESAHGILSEWEEAVSISTFG